MPLSKATLKSQLESGPLSSTCPSSSAVAAMQWTAALTAYFTPMTSPPVGSGASGPLGSALAGLSSAMSTSTDAATTFAAIDVAITAIGALAASTAVGAAVYGGTFGDYAFEGVIDEDTSSGAADKIASNIHNHITSIDNCTYTPTGAPAAVVWA